MTNCLITALEVLLSGALVVGELVADDNVLKIANQKGCGRSGRGGHRSKVWTGRCQPEIAPSSRASSAIQQTCTNMNTPNDLKRELDAKLGTSLNPSWLADCLAFLEGLNKNGLPSQARLRSMVEDQLLYSNLGVSTLGCLPEDVAERHATVLQGHFLLQVQDCINVSEPSDRHFLHTANRTLKLGLFDGKISVSAMELSHIPQISMEMPAGFKVRRILPPNA